MAASVTTSLPLWLAGCTYDANAGTDLRNSMVAATFFDPGIVSGSTIGVRSGVIGGAGLFVQPNTGMTVKVQPGSYVVAVSSNASYGAYVSTLPSQAILTVQTADPSNPRIDIVVANVVDNGNSTSLGEVQIITGVAAASPSAPAAPANSITLAQLAVPAAASTITSGMLTDTRPFTTTTGGILVAPVGSVSGYLGQIAYDTSSGRFYHNNNTTSATQLHVLPWEPVISTLSSNFYWSGAEATVLSETITTDGYTNIELYWKWAGLACNQGSGFNYSVTFRMYIDSTQVDTLYTPSAVADNVTHMGGAWSYYTSSATGDTPSAGSHTVKVTAQSPYFTGIAGSSTAKTILRVEPVAT